MLSQKVSAASRRAPGLAQLRFKGTDAVMGSIFGTITVETPKFTMVKQGKGFEVREYGPQLRAEVEYSGNMTDKLNGPFMSLAGFIFGKNTAKDSARAEKVEMTAPVIMQENEKAEKVAMTAPVVMTRMSEHDPASHKMSFIMPSKYTAETLPMPKDAKVIITEHPGYTVAAITFNGYLNSTTTNAKEAELRALCEKENVKLDPEPTHMMLCGYNPPWTLPWYRKNEVMIPVL
jgi:hypothetical protein